MWLAGNRQRSCIIYVMMHSLELFYILLELLLLYLTFSHFLRGVDVSYETPPFSPGLRVLP